jgi:hypothetical protein
LVTVVSRALERLENVTKYHAFKKLWDLGLTRWSATAYFHNSAVLLSVGETTPRYSCRPAVFNLATTTDSALEPEPANAAGLEPLPTDATTTPLTASSTPSLPEQPKELPVDAEQLRFKVPFERHLGVKEYRDGVVKYAYKTDTKLADLAASSQVVADASRAGLDRYSRSPRAADHICSHIYNG